jgi:protein involved in sex pheromone biosynthesis
MKKSISIAMAALVILLSSCASNRSHYQVKKGKVTKENKCPDCINAW